MRSLHVLFVGLALAVPAGILSAAVGSKDVDVVGRITQITPESKQLTVLMVNGDQLKFHVNERTKLDREGRTVALDSFLVGDPVKVCYTPGTERNEALSVTSNATIATEVRQRVRDTLKSAEKCAYRDKEQFKTKLHNVLQDLNAQIANLEARAKTASAEARKRYGPEIATLKKRAQTISSELANNITSATEAGWQDVKKGTAKAMHGLGDALERAGNWLRNK